MSTDLRKRNIPFSPPDMTEEEANEVKDAILSGWITTGPRTKKLEKLLAGYVGVDKAVCLNSQTACGEMALRLLGVGPGDEVIVPAYTYTASASVVTHVGATLVLVDVQRDNFQMDYDKMAAAITERTKAIIPVDLGGLPCDYDRMYEVVLAKKDLFRPSNDIQKRLGHVAICADGAHALGAWHSCKSNINDNVDMNYKRMVGSIADFTSFSFHAVKNFTTGEGGALSWNLPFGNEAVKEQQTYYGSPIPMVPGETWNEFLYRLSQLFSLHGQNKDALAKTRLGAWEYDIIGPWYKCNMTDIAAAVGLIQFQRYPEMLAKRKLYIERYNLAINKLNAELRALGKNIQVVVFNHYNGKYWGSGHLYITRLVGLTREETNEVIDLMAERGIATNVHYKPLPMMTGYKAMGFDIKDFPNAYHLYENELTLPLYTRMSKGDVEYVIENFAEVVKNL